MPTFIRKQRFDNTRNHEIFIHHTRNRCGTGSSILGLTLIMHRVAFIPAYCILYFFSYVEALFWPVLKQLKYFYKILESPNYPTVPSIFSLVLLKFRSISSRAKTCFSPVASRHIVVLIPSQVPTATAWFSSNSLALSRSLALSNHRRIPFKCPFPSCSSTAHNWKREIPIAFSIS